MPGQEEREASLFLPCLFFCWSGVQADGCYRTVVCVGGRFSTDFPLMTSGCCFSLSLPFPPPCCRVSANPEKLMLKNDTLAKSLGEAFFSDPSGYTLMPIGTWDMNDTTPNRPSWHILLTRCGPTPSVISEGFRKRRVRSRLSQQRRSTVQYDCASLTQAELPQSWFFPQKENRLIRGGQISLLSPNFRVSIKESLWDSLLSLLFSFIFNKLKMVAFTLQR